MSPALIASVTTSVMRSRAARQKMTDARSEKLQQLGSPWSSEGNTSIPQWSSGGNTSIPPWSSEGSAASPRVSIPPIAAEETPQPVLASGQIMARASRIEGSNGQFVQGDIGVGHFIGDELVSIQWPNGTRTRTAWPYRSWYVGEPLPRGEAADIPCGNSARCKSEDLRFCSQDTQESWLSI